MKTIPVLIVGGGPVGLSTAIALARHGVRSLLVERHPSTTDHPKARAVNLRTMELFRLWGLEGAVHREALPQEYWRFRWCETLAGREIGSVSNPDGESSVHSPTTRRILSQDVVERLLYEQAASLPPAEIRFSTQADDIRQNGAGVAATLTDRTSGATERVRAAYVVAADGARSRLRERLGIAMVGPEALSHQSSIYFRADLRPWCSHRPADIHYCTEGDWIAVVNGSTRWLAIVRYHPDDGQSRRDFTPEECLAKIRRSVGAPDLAVEVINTAFWTLGAQVAERFRQDRVFLAGDAAHRMSPTGGFGMNTGIQDAHNLAWKLAAVLSGQAGPALLDSYESERKPVAQKNVDWSADNARRIWSITAATHARAGDQLDALLAEQENHLCSEGLALGFRYGSPATAERGAEESPSSTRRYVPTARPGSRAPHVWLSDGGAPVSTLDLFGRRFTLLAPSRDDAWRESGRQAERRWPGQLELVTVGPGGRVQDPSGEWLESYGLEPDGAVLVRPDGHVAWRSRSAVTDPAALLDGAMRQALVLDS